MIEAADRPTFGELLREARIAAGLSQEALAERARLSVDGIGALERGINKAPQRETLALLLEALQLEPQQREAIEAAAQRPSRPRTPAHRSKKQNLPRVLTPLFGREKDLTAILRLAAQSRVLTLTGAGGVGKTRLAIDAGFAELRNHRDGVWFVDLAPVRDASGVAAAIAAVFGARERPDRTLLDGIAGALRQKDLLLILDNCEHVATAVAAAVEFILANCAGVHILATGRQQLDIAGEQTYRVSSLDLQASVSLFIDSARRADASFALEEHELPIVQRICGRLDGIALAIELAAARVKLLSLGQIEELLAERFAVLTGGARLTRHRTMLEVMAWSYGLLAAEEQMLFDRLSVFTADFALEAVVAICSGEGLDRPAVLDLLTSLVDKSLVTSERHGKARRFRLLETMRAYALQKVGPAIDGLRRRHAGYYAEIAQTAEASPQPLPVALENEYENFRQALDWSMGAGGDAALGVRLLRALRDFLLLRGLAAESARSVERLMERSTELAPPLAAMAWEMLAAMRGDLLAPVKAFDAVNRSLELYEQLGDRGGEARALRGRGIAYLRLGSFDEAEKDLERALELIKAHGDRRDLARTLGSIAILYQMTGRLEEARKIMLTVLEMARAVREERLVWVSLTNLAETEFALGEIASAASRLEELLASKMARQNLLLRGNAKSNLAAYLLALNREDEAHAMARSAIFDAREAGEPGIVCCALGHLAAMLAPNDARNAARLLGYVESNVAYRYRREHTERYTHERLTTALSERLSEDEIAVLSRDGAAMSEAKAVRIATRTR